jgi:hypothetical protein
MRLRQGRVDTSGCADYQAACFTGFEYDLAITLTDLSRFLATARFAKERVQRVIERAWRAEIGTA